MRFRTVMIGLLVVLAVSLALAKAGGVAQGKSLSPNDSYCVKIGKGISVDPNEPGNEQRVFDLHARGCSEWQGAWRKTYTQNANRRCNEIAYQYATTGISTKNVIKLTKGQGCVQFEDGTYGAKS